MEKLGKESSGDLRGAHLEKDDESEANGEQLPVELGVLARVVAVGKVAARLRKSAVGRRGQTELGEAVQIPVVLVLVEEFGQELRSERDEEGLKKRARESSC